MEIKKNATYGDIAKYTKFSKTTISRYFNDPDTLAPASREIIAKALVDLDYQENKVARILANGRTEFIGVIVPDFYHHFFYEILNHILGTYENNGYKFLVFVGNKREEVERRYIQELMAYQIEGLIVLSHTIHSRGLAQLQIPVVTIEREDQFVCSVNTDNDENAILSIDGGLTVGGASIAAIYYGYETGAMSTSNAGVAVDSSTSSEMVDMYNNSWKTHVVDRSSICEAFADLNTAQLEFDDRTPRNIVVCPGSSSEGDWSNDYVLFNISARADNNTGRIYLTNTGATVLLGSGNENNINAARATFQPFLDFCFSEEGIYMYEDSDSYVYVLSPTSDLWFRMRL